MNTTNKNMKEKKVPIRKCVVTNTQHPKMEMFRVVIQLGAIMAVVVLYFNKVKK